MSDVKNLRILVVDDHPDTVALMARILAKRGHTIECAHTVADARVAAATHPCDLLITDGGLPDGDGVSLMRELNALYGMKAILVSGSVDDGADVEADGFRFLAKPVNVQSLLDALASLQSK